MSHGPNLPGLAIGMGVLVVCVLVLLPGRRKITLRRMGVGAILGAVAYPLGMCLFMGAAAARVVDPSYAWARFRFAFATYAQAAPEEMIPRGAVLGAFLVAVWALRRRGRGKAPGATAEAGLTPGTRLG